MASSNGSPGSTAVSVWKNFNGEFLGYSVVTGVLAVFFLLYFNRVLASLLSYLLRTYTWHRYRIYIDIQALQFSLLGGRVFFTGLRYHGNNETIIIQNGHITWSYWLRRVRDAQIYADKRGAEGDDDSTSATRDRRQKLPCRINVSVSGLEWFVYNRAAAYDTILEAMTNVGVPPLAPEHEHKYGKAGKTLDTNGTLSNGSSNPRKRRCRPEKTSDISSDEKDKEDASTVDDKASSGGRPHPIRVLSTVSDGGDGSPSGAKAGLPLMLQLYPIHFECDIAALVMGNDHTKALLIAKTKFLSGDIDAAECETPDPYRQLFEIKLGNLVLEMKEHDGYREDQLTRAVREKQVARDAEPIKRRSLFRRQRRKALGQLRNLVPYWRKSVESFSVDSLVGVSSGEPPIPGLNHWQGLSRYLNADDADDKLRWSSVEYAAVNTVVESPECVLTILWDVPGQVSQSQNGQPLPRGRNSSKFINGTTAPAWAIKVALKGGTINYGPWADRQRAELQRIFFPGVSKDSIPAGRLHAGEARVPTIFNFYLELNDEVTLRIPTREDSKNWRWKKEEITLKQQQKNDRRRDRGRNRKYTATTAAEQRPFGWLDVKVGANATVSYEMDMLAGPIGYGNSLKIDLPSTEVSTSVNHSLLWRSGAQRISCDLSTPLKWNGPRTWQFNIDGDKMELFILRDHIFLLIDLIDDWGTGPPPEYLLFTPFKYLVNLTLRDLKLYINVNDVNIINDPISFDENTYLVLSSPCLTSETSINLDTYRPSKNMVPFQVTADSLQLGLHVPPWNTQASFLSSKDIGSLENLILDGKYHYNSTTSPANTDTLVLDVTTQSLTLQLYGFLIRYCLQMKDNYFGDHVHFKTLDEYQQSLRLKAEDPDAELLDQPPPKKSNDLDVMLSILVDDPKVVLPANLYTARRHIAIEAAYAAVDLRFTNYYMDLDLSFAPLSLSYGDEEEEAASPASVASKTQLFIDGLAVYGNRLFGLPPTEPTYLCNWDLNVGAITGETSIEFLKALAQGGRSFGFSLDDDENALIPYSSIVSHDVTFLRVFVQSIQMWLHVEESVFLFSTDSLEVNYNDWARTHYSRRADIRIPRLELSCLESESTARHNVRVNSRVNADLFFQTSLHFALIGRKYDFAKARQIQQELVQRHDQRTQRTKFLLIRDLLNEFRPDFVELVAQSIPPVPHPTIGNTGHDDISLLSRSSAPRSRGIRRKSSFLSFSSSSDAKSIRQLSSENTRSRSRSAHHSLQQSKSTTQADIHSNFTPSNRHSGKQHPAHTTVAFTSQFLPPYFPLETIHPLKNGGTLLQAGEKKSNSPLGDVSFGLEDIDSAQFPQDSSYQSLVFDFTSGIDAVLNTASLRCIASLLRALHPTEPEDILDGLQMGAISDIFGIQKQERLRSATTDFVLRLPHATVRFLNNFGVDEPSQAAGQDQFDAMLKDMAFALRSEKYRRLSVGHDKPKSPLPSFHFRMASLTFAVAENMTFLGKSQATANLSVEKIIASMGSKDLTYADSEIGSICVKSSSSRVAHLISVIQRTKNVIREFEELFSRPSSAADDRLKYFTHRVITEGQRASDPSFVVRPSAILRAASRHLRTYDSWKLVTRLRHMWATLGPRNQEALMRDCFSSSMRVPDDVREQVVSSFDHWRSWDLENTSHAVLLDNIFGKSSLDDVNLEHNPWMAVCRIRRIQTGLDPGPKRNEITILEMTARIQERQNNYQEDIHQQNISQGLLTIINLYCEQANVNLNWELCELANHLSPLYRFETTQDTGSNKKPDQKAPVKSKALRSVHFVSFVRQGTISLDTINLSVEPRCQNLKLSVLNRQTEQNSMTTDVIINSDAATLMALSHSQSLLIVRLEKPAIILAHELLSVKDYVSHIIRAAASSQDIVVAVEQDPIVMAEVVDLLVRDEAAQIHDLQQKFTTAQLDKTTDRASSGQSPSLSVDLAMFLDSYTIRVPLLRSLTYKITGTVARATIAAVANKQVVFNFDVKENSHDMQVGLSNAPRSISLLQIPPVNGRITMRTAPRENSITVFASLELVHLDASAVYSLLSALNRPEISSAVNDLQQQIKVIQGHAEDIFDSSGEVVTSPSQTDQPILIYDVHATLAGVKIIGQAPIRSNVASSALLSFCLDRIHLQVANKIDGSNVLENPEVHINVHNISFDINKCFDEADTRSCGNIGFGALITASTHDLEDGSELRSLDLRSTGFVVNLSSDTISTFVDVLGYMGDKFKDLDTSRELEYLRKLRQSKPRIAINDEELQADTDIFDSFLTSIMYSLEIRDIQIGWLVATDSDQPLAGQEDLYLTVKMIEFASRKRNAARLTIEDLQLQLVPPGHDKSQRSANSALLPEMVFNVAFVSTHDSRRLAFQAVGKSLNLRLTSAFIVPVAYLKDSIMLSVGNVQRASQRWAPIASRETNASHLPDEPTAPRRKVFGSKRLESVLVDADFAGAVVHLSGKKIERDELNTTSSKFGRRTLGGKYSQFQADETGNNTTLRSPGLAWKAEYRDNGQDDASLHGEVKIERSQNVLFPGVVPLIMEISSSIKDVVRNAVPDTTDPPAPKEKPSPKPKSGDDENILTADPGAVLGRVKLNLGLRICNQEFTLSCQPIGRVAATARCDDIYVTINTVHSIDHGNFFAISGKLSKIHFAVQHVYSRESTGSFNVDSIVLSLMNSKHVSGTSGLFAIVKMSPMKVAINARQVHDFLLFREIWLPREIRQSPSAPLAELTKEAAAQGHLMQRYQQVAATAAFPWTATISISALDVAVDLGQSLGKPEFAIKDFWVSSKKTSDWEQNLCLGFEQIGITCDARLSGFVSLQNFQLRTSIEWPAREQALNETPRIQASVGFSQFRTKVAFDYQAFFVADITSLNFLMYNVRQHKGASGDRLVAIFDAEAVQAFGITGSAAQGAALWKAIQKFVQERKANYETSLQDIEKYMKQRSITNEPIARLIHPKKVGVDSTTTKSPISLDTDVVVTLRAVNLGVFPSNYADNQVFKLEALNARARFAASMEDQRIHSILGLTLGQLRIGLASVRGSEMPRTVREIEVEHVIQNATGSRGGTILKVPKVEAVMETWQRPSSRAIQYKFKSTFEGKVEVGWNYSRISYIRGMWAKHSRMLDQVWGREISTVSAIKVTGVPEPEQERKDGEQQKITAEVSVPQSKYEYEALEPPIIETPQLRDMGEATPPLEWIGLNRDKLPNLTHQIVIVALLELAGEVEDAYSSILGSS
ncbi:putative fermentation associated protein [Xylariaceae sp. FL0255]|nr:putative fermentation associated protein [Xylariaceae sp. FL0255]